MTLILFLIINAFASYFQGVVGFGHALIATPLSLTFLSKGTALTAMMVAGTVLCGFLSNTIDGPLDKDIFKPMLIWSLIGMPFGVFILKFMPIAELRVFVAMLSIACTSSILFLKFKVRDLSRATPIAGFLCGMLQSSAGMSGAPAVLLLTGANVPKNSMRKIMQTLFFWLSILTLPLYAISGIFTVQGLIFGLCAVPVVMLAGHLGNKSVKFVPHSWYQRISLATIGLTGVYVVISTLR